MITISVNGSLTVPFRVILFIRGRTELLSFFEDHDLIDPTRQMFIKAIVAYSVF